MGDGRPAGAFYPMIDTRLYFRNIGFNQASFLVSVIVGFLLSPFIVRQLGDAGNGYWSLVVSITAYFGYFDLGIQSGVNHFVTRHLADRRPEMLNGKFNSALTVLLCIGALAVVGSVILSALLPRFFRVPEEAVAPVRTTLLLMGLITAAKFPFSAFQAVLIGAQRYDITSGTALSVRVLNALLLFYALTARQDLVALAVVVAFTQILEGSVLAFFALRVVPELRVRPFRFEFAAFRELFDYGAFNFAINIFAQFGAGYGALIIGRKLDAVAVTYYTIGLDLIPYMSSVISALSIPLLQMVIPMDVRGDMDSLRTLYLTGSRYVAGITCFIAANLLLVGPAFLGQWMGGKYLQSGPYGSSGDVLLIHTFAAMATLFATVAQLVLLGRRKNKIYAAVIVIETLGIVALSHFLIPRFGILGVAMAAFIPTLLTQTFGLNFLASRYAGTDYFRFLRTALLPNLAVLALAYGLGRLLLPPLPAESGWGPIFLSFTAVSVVYLAVSLPLVPERGHLRLVADTLMRRFAAVERAG